MLFGTEMKNEMIMELPGNFFNVPTNHHIIERSDIYIGNDGNLISVLRRNKERIFPTFPHQEDIIFFFNNFTTKKKK